MFVIDIIIITYILSLLHLLLIYLCYYHLYYHISHYLYIYIYIHILILYICNLYILTLSLYKLMYFLSQSIWGCWIWCRSFLWWIGSVTCWHVGIQVLANRSLKLFWCFYIYIQTWFFLLFIYLCFYFFSYLSIYLFINFFMCL